MSLCLIMIGLKNKLRMREKLLNLGVGDMFDWKEEKKSELHVDCLRAGQYTELVADQLRLI